MLKELVLYINIIFLYLFVLLFWNRDIDNEYTVSFFFVQGEEIKEYSQIVKHGEDLDFMLPLNEHEIEGMYFTSWKLNNFLILKAKILGYQESIVTENIHFILTLKRVMFLMSLFLNS